MRPTSWTRFLPAALTLLGLQPTLAQPARIERPGARPIVIGQPDGRQPAEIERPRGEGERARPCRTDRLIIDYVGDARQEIDLEQVGQRLAGRLRAAPDICQGWYGQARNDCRPVVRRIVDQDTANRARVPQLSPLHVELTFVDGAGRTLPLGEHAICDAVGSLRWLLQDTYGDRARRDFYVSRACDASVQGNWAGERVRAAAPPLAGRRRGGIVAIVDGPHTREGDVVVQPRAGMGDGPVSAATVDYGHADAVGLLVRRASPRAEIRYYTALDAGGTGSPIGQVANGIARAVADAAGAPLVVNLSLGWPRDMQSEAAVSGPSPRILNHFTRQQAQQCRGAESPAGEVVRAWMRALADRDVIFVAAAGNRRAAPGAALGTPTKPAAMFYPAAWTRELPNLLAVGAYGRRPVPELGVGMSPTNRPDLYAPGLRVPTERPTPLQQTVPILLTGTSGAAALVSGALANSPIADRLDWLRGRLNPCPVQALPGTRALFLGGCPDGDLTRERKKVRPIRRRIQPRRPIRATPRVPARATLGGSLAPQPGNGARIAIDRYSAGSVGPQPGDDGCLVPCRFLLDTAAGKGDLDVKMELGAPAIVKNPRLVFRSGAEKDTLFLPASGVPTTPIKTLELDTKDVPVSPPIKADKSLEVSLEFELEPQSGGKTVRRDVALQVLQSP